MILVHTGNGKGKTSASVGQAIRALGQGMRVGFFQYMKHDGVAGEQKILRTLLGDDFIAGGLGFLRNPEQFAEHRAAGRELTERVISRIPELDLVVLDEALYALKAAVLTQEELREMLALCERHTTHLVLSGRDVPRWLEEATDLVTEMREMKHPYMQGLPAERGIDF